MAINIEISKNLLDAFNSGLDRWTIICIMCAIMGPRIIKVVQKIK